MELVREQEVLYCETYRLQIDDEFVKKFNEALKYRYEEIPDITAQDIADAFNHCYNDKLKVIYRSEWGYDIELGDIVVEFIDDFLTESFEGSDFLDVYDCNDRIED